MARTGHGSVWIGDRAFYRCSELTGALSLDGVVTIGRSIDCTLQLAWDPMGNIAPVQAELHRHGDVITLYAVEDGVFVKDNRPLPVGKPMKLYHGDSFQIGRTTFTYIEKDL